MATVFDMMTGHATMLARAYRAQANAVPWAKVVAVAIHSRRSKFVSDVAYLELARELEQAAKKRLDRERRAKPNLSRLPPSEHHEWTPPTLYESAQYRPEKRQGSQGGGWPLRGDRTGAARTPAPPGERVRSYDGTIVMIPATKAKAARSFAAKGWKVTA
jgi:hypothetical protein